MQASQPSPTDANPFGQVLAIAIRTEKKGPMKEVPAARATAGEGLEGDLPAKDYRGVTLLSKAQWADVQAELAADLPWHTRRANVLIDAGSLATLIGKKIRLGEVDIQVNAETEPCGLMDELHPGLRAALTPECRGGVYGKVLTTGQIKIGDKLTITQAP